MTCFLLTTKQICLDPIQCPDLASTPLQKAEIYPALKERPLGLVGVSMYRVSRVEVGPGARQILLALCRLEAKSRVRGMS